MPTLSDMQNDAVNKIAAWFPTARGGDPFYLAGFAGTGKSTILPDIIDGCGLAPSQVAFCAPTGKAAKVMREKLKAQGWDVTATTIHSLIYKRPGEEADRVMEHIRTLDAQIHAEEAVLGGELGEADRNAVAAQIEKWKIELKRLEARLAKALQDKKQGLTFQFNEESSARSKRLIVVDEASMVGEYLAADLARFGVPILAIGDPGQLPPVSEKPGFTNREPDFFLTEIHRQAADNPIIWLSAEIRAGRRPGIGEYGQAVKIISRKQDNVTTDLTRDLQVICGTHKTRFALTAKIRRALGYSGKTAPQEGEPVLIARNSRQHPALVNGSIVWCAETVPNLVDGDPCFPIKVVDADEVPYSLTVFQSLFEEHVAARQGATTLTDRALYSAKKSYQHADFGWVLTCHKSQGSQWDEVVVHDESRSFRDESDRWLYTAVTRAAQRLTVVSG